MGWDTFTDLLLLSAMQTDLKSVCETWINEKVDEFFVHTIRTKVFRFDCNFFLIKKDATTNTNNEKRT